jgi:hypothetical protein
MFTNTALLACALLVATIAAEPAWLSDPSKRLAAAGLPTAFATTEPKALKNMLHKQFPFLQDALPHVQAQWKNASRSGAKYGEFVRFTAFSMALAQRNTADDRAVLKVIRGGGTGMECTVCTWVISHVKSEIADHGCDAAAGIFAGVCAAIPYIDVVVAECVWVLKWACGKIAEHLEDGVASSTTICNDVFDGICQ